MKKTIMCLLAACLLCVVLPASEVRADLIDVPDDDFWSEHSSECEYLYRQYTVNAPEGYAALWESPESDKQSETMANGTVIAGKWLYTDSEGEVWCAIEDSNDVLGWIRTSECLAVPDYISFQEAYGQEFTEYDPAYDNAFDGVATVTFWKYPCSGIAVIEDMDMGEMLDDGNSPEAYFSTYWKDPQGRMWGFVTYWRSIRNVWVCLDDPAGEQLEKIPAAGGTEEPGAEETATGEPATGELGAENSGTTDILPDEAVHYEPAEEVPEPTTVTSGKIGGGAVAGVAGVMAVSAALIGVFFAKKPKKESEQK